MILQMNQNIFTPCHTKGHICYYVEDANREHVIFTGDTLFQGGCGRFFEGTAEDMYTALCKKLAKIPDDTQVFCGHEYTVNNLAFAHHVEPKNEKIMERLEWAKQRREEHLPTVPSTIGGEKLWNPFMRVGVPAVQKHATEHTAIATMATLRKEKDTFKG